MLHVSSAGQCAQHVGNTQDWQLEASLPNVKPLSKRCPSPGSCRKGCWSLWAGSSSPGQTQGEGQDLAGSTLLGILPKGSPLIR